MDESPEFWLGLQRERTGLAWTRTLAALSAAQILVVADGLRTARSGPVLVGAMMFAVTGFLALKQYRAADIAPDFDTASPAQGLAAATGALLLLALGGLLIVLG